jgi:hypothetical protein
VSRLLARMPKSLVGVLLAVLALAVVLGLAVASAPMPTLAVPADQAPSVLAAWVALGPDGALLARAVTAQATCPDLTLGSSARPMALRAASSPPAFPVRVCEAAIPLPATGGAAIAGQPLPILGELPRRILVLGDTGCRLKEGDPIQDCNDPRAWPFAEIARSAAAWQPDLVIHVGDFHYRESSCPPKYDGCAGSPWGDNWAAWHADLFGPAAPLLRAAPWVFVRGNHELCSRAGEGWFRFLDPGPLPATCTDYGEPYAVPLGELQLLVLDTAAADDRTARPDEVATYAAQYAAVRALATSPAWLLQHKPLWAIGQSWDDPGPSGIFRSNPMLQAASDNALPPAIEMVLAGHIHNWTAFSFADRRAPQFVIGNGGTGLDAELSVPLTGLDIAGTTVASGSAWHDYGYMTLERTNAGWQATLSAADGAPVLQCTVRDHQAVC